MTRRKRQAQAADPRRPQCVTRIVRAAQRLARALMTNCQTVSCCAQRRTVELKPNGRTRKVDAVCGRQAPDDALSRELVDDTNNYDQVAAKA
jgi:hypothetical protein